MRYREVPPPAALLPFVRCFWLLEGARQPGDLERVLPDGCAEIVIHYAAPMRDQPRAIAAGQLRSALQLVVTGDMGMVGARLQSWAGGTLLGEAQHRLADQVVPLAALWGPASGRLEERIRHDRDDASRLRSLAEALSARHPRPREAHRSLSTACRWIAESGGRVSVDAIARGLQWNRRRLERHFREEVGLTPKALCRIERFRRVASRLGLPRPPTLAELALRAGYSDQSHLARDFRELAGLPVTSFLAEQHALSDCLTGGSPGEAGPDYGAPPLGASAAEGASPGSLRS